MSYRVQINSQLNCIVFKTNIKDKYKASQLVYVLEKMEGITDWSLDLEDRDHVLRIKFESIDSDFLKNSLSPFRIKIEEMPIW